MKNDLTYSICLRILELCADRGITVNRMCTKCCVPQSTVNDWLHGKTKRPTVHTIKLLCDGMGITLDKFFASPLFRNLDWEEP